MPQRLGQDQRQIGAEQHQDAVAEIDDMQHAEDQREADGCQRIDAAQHQAVGQRLRNQVIIASIPTRSLIAILHAFLSHGGAG